jgi:hypothetical protein
MTIDEAIKREKDIIENKKIYAEKHCVTQEFYADIEYLEQLAEWLEELKAIRRWKADVMEDFCRYDVNSFEELINNTRKKTIDELVNILIGYFNGFSHEVYAQVSIRNFICDSIKIITEKLKEGDSNGT